MKSAELVSCVFATDDAIEESENFNLLEEKRKKKEKNNDWVEPHFYERRNFRFGSPNLSRLSIRLQRTFYSLTNESFIHSQLTYVFRMKPFSLSLSLQYADFCKDFIEKEKQIRKISEEKCRLRFLVFFCLV